MFRTILILSMANASVLKDIKGNKVDVNLYVNKAILMEHNVCHVLRELMLGILSKLVFLVGWDAGLVGESIFVGSVCLGWLLELMDNVRMFVEMGLLLLVSVMMETQTIMMDVAVNARLK